MGTYTGQDKRIQFLFDMVSNFAPIYSNTGTYAVGAYAIYQGVLYKCTTAVTVAEDFDPTKWTQVLIMNEIGSGGGGGSTVTITPTLSSGTKIADYSINGVGGELYAPSGGGGSGHNYSQDEQIIGTWWTGETLYERVIVLPNRVAPPTNHAWSSTNVNVSYIKQLVYSSVNDGSKWNANSINVFVDANILKLVNLGASAVYVKEITIRYTKTA